MIKKITIENFQSHSFSEFILDEHLNVIHGVSDSGKSAVRKAVQAVLNRGPFYLKYGESKGSVTIEFDDCIISREYTRAKVVKCPSCKEKIGEFDQKCESCGESVPEKVSSDRYFIDGEKFEKFGTNLPPMITEKMRMSEVIFGDISINLNVATQFEDMFFIGKSYNGNVRNKMISGLVPDSEQVDLLATELNSEKNTLRSQIKLMNTEVDDNKIKLEMIEKDVADLGAIYKEIESLESNLTNLKASLSNLMEIKETINGITFTGKVKAFLEKHEHVVDKAIKFIGSFEKMVSRHDRISACGAEIKKLKILNVDFPAYRNSVNVIEQMEQATNDFLMLKVIKKDLAALQILQVEMPEMISDDVSILMTQIDKQMHDKVVISEVKKTHSEIKNKMESALNDKDKVQKASEILFKKFKDECPDLVCPHRGDVYSDECLEKFGK